MLGITDIDILILLKLEDDRDLANYFQINQRCNEISKNEHFWMRRLITKYGSHLQLMSHKSANSTEILYRKIRERYLNGRSWKEYYMIYTGTRFIFKGGFVRSGKIYVGFHLHSHWSRDGGLKREEKKHFNREGQLDGLQKTWEMVGKGENTNIRRQYTNYKNGEKDGVERIYYFNVLISECYYREGKKHGIHREWYDPFSSSLSENNICVKFIHNFVNGLPEGEVKGWFPNGQLEYEREFKDGVLVKDLKWDEHGNERKVLSNGAELVKVNGEWRERKILLP